MQAYNRHTPREKHNTSVARGFMRPIAQPIVLAGLVIAILSTGPVTAKPSELIKRFSDWAAYRHTAGKEKFCFILAAPDSRKPANVKRGKIAIHITAWPKHGIRAQLSVKIGYRFKAGVPVGVAIGNAQFNLFTQNDRAFVDSPTDELKLIEAMKKGSRMIITGQSERGTVTTDVYSLIGFSLALQKMTSSCS
jgi:hypothetical protein